MPDDEHAPTAINAKQIIDSFNDLASILTIPMRVII
jgi:hypothetical protein